MATHVEFVAKPTRRLPMKTSLIQLTLRAAQYGSHFLSAAELAVLCSAVQMDHIERMSADERGDWLRLGLMGAQPQGFLIALRSCAGLRRLLPELEALFGVPQLSDAAEAIDVGEHQLRVMIECARIDAPFAVRFAALAHKFGKGGTPREIWPSHYKHEVRGHAAVEAMRARIALPEDAVALAHLAIDEVDRVHRASDMRAGAITMMLDRLRALDEPARFAQLLDICTCDFAAHAGHTAAGYPKAPRLRRALAAYAAVPADGRDADALLEARAAAVAVALRGTVSSE